MSNHEPLINDELEVAEAKHPLVDLLYDYTARVVMSRPGHYVYNKFDAGLSIVEKTAKWSLPQSPPSEEDTSKTTISAPPLIRPLPWILFLPALIALRMIRHSLSLMALLIGKQPVDPVTMVSSLQNFRRKLRAFKYRGLKLKRIQRAEKEAEPRASKQPKQANTLLRQIMFPLRYMICLVGFRSEITTTHRDHHHHHHHHHHRHQTKRPSEQPREVSQEPAANGPQRAEPSDLCPNKKRNAHERDADDSDSSLDEATVQELLEKYADAEADSSYHPSIAMSSDSDSDIFESDKSQPEASAEDAEKYDPKKIKKESNGHAATNGKEPEPEAEKPHEPKPKSSLNTNANNGNPENGTAAPENQQKEEKTAEASQKSAGAGNESKPANESNPIKEPPQDVSSKNDNQNSSNKHSPTSMKEVKTNFHQKNKQQQHQQQHQIQPTQQQHQQHHQQQQQQQQHQQQHQQHQQQCTAVNGGGGGRKHKKPHHYNAPHN